MDVLTPKFTGRRRHRIQKIGWLKPTHVLVLQYEVKGFVPEYYGGQVDGSMRCWWVDARPEWEMQNDVDSIS
jgi:hypothetical protein